MTSPALTPAERRFLLGSIGLTALVIALASFARHALLQSNLFDLGIFDQAVYLLSQGQPPFVTTLGFPILGDHAAFILYPLSLLYRLAPWVGWLFITQAAGLALGAWPLYLLARREGLDIAWSRAVTVAYLAYPAVFNVGIFDFHPETLAMAALLWCLWAGLEGRYVQLAIATLLVLSCKEALSLTLLMLGVWLAFTRRSAGLLLAAVGAGWYGLTAYCVIPALSGRPPAAIDRYAYLGHTLSGITLHVLTHPQILLLHLVTLGSLAYLLGLAASVVLGLHWRQCGALAPASAMLVLNLLSTEPLQRDLVHQYALPIVPFVMWWLIRSLAYLQARGARRWLTPRILVVWSLIGFLALAKYGYFFSLYRSHLSNYAAATEGLALVQGSGGVLTTSALAAQLAHRKVIQMTNRDVPITESLFDPYRYVLVDTQHPEWGSSPAYARAMVEALRGDRRFQAQFAASGIFLFGRVAWSATRQSASSSHKNNPPGG